MAGTAGRGLLVLPELRFHSGMHARDVILEGKRGLGAVDRRAAFAHDDFGDGAFAEIRVLLRQVLLAILQHLAAVALDRRGQPLAGRGVKVGQIEPG